MNEEDIVLQGVELDTAIDVGLPIEDVAYSEVSETISVEQQEEIAIDVTEIAGVVSGYGESSNHEHNIDQISNLENTLNKLGALRDTYGEHSGFAEFQEWKSDGHYKTDKYYETSGGVGFFVSLVSETGATDGGNLRIADFVAIKVKNIIC